MLIADQDWSQLSDSSVWHAAQGGATGAAEELRRREDAHRLRSMKPEARAAMASRVKNGVAGL
jgi:hypothetical protein